MAIARMRAGLGWQLELGWVPGFCLGGFGGKRLLATVNYPANHGQCYVRLPFPDLAGHAVRFKDLMGLASYDRDGNDVASKGLYLDLPPWGYHVFAVGCT